ncbi:branched-chain amino acid ABC transporter permease [Ensifer sp. ENS06]|uniref:branched-chain amino acid ABC transporter permease n=1 Tax=Ensifer sp. ENS06 TaxID=2769276 RepID=UPI00177CFB44|nr:branched-chain amino acid ABC transporter permease [Ensifer sp. ENS06]MBD9627070.1 branched-chain amino acid ABC transporter permease [Ensifer sp. ENS06]
MTEIVNLLLQGIMIGGLYALFACGLSLTFGMMRIVNLAHGDLIVAAAFMAFSIADTVGLGFFPAIVLTPVLMGIVGYGLQRWLLNRVIGNDILPPLLVTFGLSVIIQNGILQLFSADSRKLSIGSIETDSLTIMPGVSVGSYALIVFAVSVLAVLILHQISNRSALGRGFRATADDPDVARLMGVPTQHIFGLAMGMALALCGLAGVLFSVWTSFTPVAGPSRLLIAFEVIVIGGIGSIWGTLLGGVVLGLSQALGGYLNPSWQTLAGHIAFLGIMMIWPTGLLSRRHV